MGRQRDGQTAIAVSAVQRLLVRLTAELCSSLIAVQQRTTANIRPADR